MEDDFDLDNILDSMNLTGQWQPSSMPDIVDPSLNIQILDDLIFSAADSPPSLPILNNNDDISNALIDRKCLVYLKIEEFIFKKTPE
jgi:hypothetical protein